MADGHQAAPSSHNEYPDLDEPLVPEQQTLPSTQAPAILQYGYDYNYPPQGPYPGPYLPTPPTAAWIDPSLTADATPNQLGAPYPNAFHAPVADFQSSAAIPSLMDTSAQPSSDEPPRKKVRSSLDVADPWLCYLCNRRLITKSSVQRHLKEVHWIENNDLDLNRIKLLSRRTSELEEEGRDEQNIKEKLAEVTWGLRDPARHIIRANDGANRKMGGARKIAGEELARMRDESTMAFGVWSADPITMATTQDPLANNQTYSHLQYGPTQRPLEANNILTIIAQASVEVEEGVEAQMARDGGAEVAEILRRTQESLSPDAADSEGGDEEDQAVVRVEARSDEDFAAMLRGALADLPVYRK